MRVCLISHGNLMHVVPRLRFMVERGWDVHWLQIAAGQFEVPGVVTHKLYGTEKVALSGLEKLAYLRAGYRAWKILKCLRPDVVWPHYVSSGGLVAWLSGWPRYCVTIHGSDLLDRGRTRLGRIILRRIFSRAVLVNPVADHMLDTLVALGVPKNRVFCMTHGIDLDAFPYHPHVPDIAGGLRLICTRTFNSDLYDIPTLIRAVALLARDGHHVELLLAATGPLEKRLREEVSSLKIDDRVRFGGGYRREELASIFDSYDVYVSPSLWDGTSLSLLEAMACGILPIVTDIAANNALITDGDNGFLFKAGDPEDLAAKIIAVSRSSGDIRAWLDGNRALVEECGDQQRNLGRLMSRVEETVR